MHSLALGLLISSASLGALAADSTVTVTEKVDLNQAPAQSWATIRDFMSWPAWHPAFAGTSLLKGEGNTKGSVRQLTAKDGAQFTEELVAYDAAARSYQYRILESPAPVIGYVSTIEVKETSTGSTVVWSSSFKVKPGTPEEAAKKAIAGIYRLGLDNLAVAAKEGEYR
jgi:hypothetical protein